VIMKNSIYNAWMSLRDNIFSLGTNP
jgi:hypothetical protein